MDSNNNNFQNQIRETFYSKEINQLIVMKMMLKNQRQKLIREGEKKLLKKPLLLTIKVY